MKFENDGQNLSNMDWQRLIEKTASSIGDIVNDLGSYLVGRRVKIVSNFNGQPFGSSRPKLTGREFEIAYISIGGAKHAEVYIFLKGERLSVRPNEIEFLDCGENGDGN